MTCDSPFDATGIWLRCGLHMHTTNSDGELAPDRLVAHYERAGYDAIVITDHWFRTVEAGTERLLVLPGVELNATLDGTGRDAHVLALGVTTDPEEPGATFPNLQDTVDWIRKSGGVAYLAHPYWSGLDPAEFADCRGLTGVEVYNAGCELEIARGVASVHWDWALEAGFPLHAIATDDSHLPGYDSAFAWTWARVPERSSDAVKEALAAGRFYSSTGPRIESVAIEDDAVVVSCSPAASVALVTAPPFGARANAGRMGYRSRARVLEQTPSGEITVAWLERWSSLPFGRVEVTDDGGRRAWTNALWFDRR